MPSTRIAWLRIVAAASAVGFAVGGCRNAPIGAPPRTTQTQTPVAAPPPQTASVAVSQSAPLQAPASEPATSAVIVAPLPARDPVVSAPVAQSAPAAPPKPPAPVAPVAPVALPFESAVLRAAGILLAESDKELSKTNSKLPRLLVIDPLIDASTGQQTVGTQKMGAQIASLVKVQYPEIFDVQPFTGAILERSPLLLMGTLTAMNKDNNRNERADVFRIWLTMVDLGNGRVIAKALGRATEETVDSTPTPMYRDSPTWPKDSTVEAYINSCQDDSKPGDPVHPTYLRSIGTAAIINEATVAYESGRMDDAFKFYSRAAASVEGAGQLRVLNGLYLSAWNLGKQKDAADAFGRIVNLGLTTKKLGVKFLFQPSSTEFVRDPRLSSQYAIWIGQIAAQSAPKNVCLRVVGHTSRTGSVAVNDALSLRRAETIQRRLELMAGGSLKNRMIPDGVGFRETLIGTGTDDLRDALDRRVEFNVIDCPSTGQSGRSG
ncbi:MAG: OmpA family protein [Burkholderiales bacterium]